MTSLQLAQTFLTAFKLPGCFTLEAVARDIDTYARQANLPLATAARHVVACWAEGDLAEAVRDLAEQLENLEPAPDAPAPASGPDPFMKVDLEFFAWDHPEANGKQAKAGDRDYGFTFTLEDGRKVRVRMGETGWQTHSQHVLDMLAGIPGTDDGSLARNLVKECADIRAQLTTALEEAETEVASEQLGGNPVKFAEAKVRRAAIQSIALPIIARLT